MNIAVGKIATYRFAKAKYAYLSRINRSCSPLVDVKQILLPSGKVLVAVYAVNVMLHNGEKALLREYRPQDREGLISFYSSLSQETLRWSLPPYDRARVERWTANPEQSIILLALHKEKIVGHLQVFLQAYSRALGIGELIIYLHQAFQNLGLGTIMMREAIGLARERRLHRISLSVIADNIRAIRVYEKVGFKQEGIRKEDYFGEDGRYHDVIEMGLIL